MSDHLSHAGWYSSSATYTRIAHAALVGNWLECLNLSGWSAAASHARCLY